MAVTTTPTEELVERIGVLENLLRDHIAHWELPPPDDAPPLPMSADPSSALHTPPSDGVQADYPPVGRLLTTGSGHTRYQPFHSTWDSAIVGSGGGAMTSNEDGIDDPLGQAFNQPMEDLISPLPPVSQSLLYAVLSVSVTSLNEDSPLLKDLGRRNDVSKNITTLSTRYRAAAFRCLQTDQYLFRQTLYTLQALILMSYGISHTHGDVWSLLGTAYHMALGLGCHVDPDHFGLDALECENRRRCWVGLMMLYTIQGISCGNIHRRQITSTVRLPANVNDEELTADMIAPPLESPRATEMTYMLFKYRLYEVCSRICEAVMDATTGLSPDVIASLETDIQHEREIWSRRYARDRHRPEDLPVLQQLQLHILDGYSHQLMLLLHRPFFVAANAAATACLSGEQVDASRKKCIEAARAELELHRTLHQSPTFAPYKWYSRGIASFHAFHAAVVLVTIMASSASSTISNGTPGIRAGSQQQYQELLQLITSAVQRFEEMAPQSRFCAKAAPALSNLVSSVQAQHVSVELVGGSCGGHDNRNWSGVAPPLVNALMDNLQPQYWLTPSSVPWGIWDDVIGNPNAESGFNLV
ncbi:C6 zinc finger domain-containing protein [Lasiodiplodia theobromae]|uniref:C6 zinc finger domain-containing protein n=1 Tax=Lasiodiplodia theobromae TaxID=45133 RepID=UPI0015C376CF|nr:C6 zinc finger domain-containing protein [Lasiodiplodia theobromae]KAF4544773.1 C6 zinc finger domain-containing protein [Lasiodiplodia theobromae]